MARRTPKSEGWSSVPEFLVSETSQCYDKFSAVAVRRKPFYFSSQTL